MNYEKMKLILAEELSELTTRYQHDKDTQPKGLILENIINSFKDYNYSFNQTIDNVASILNDDWVFKMTINGLFRPIDKTINIQLEVDGIIKVNNHKTWPKFMFGLASVVGIDLINQLFPDMVNKDKKKLIIKKNGDKKGNKIVPVDGFFINQQGFAGGSQNCYPAKVKVINKHFGYEKIKVNHFTKVYSSDLEKYYKL